MKRRKKLFAGLALLLWLSLPYVLGESDIPLGLIALLGFSDLLLATSFTYLAGGFKNVRNR